MIPRLSALFYLETTGLEPVTPCMSSKYSSQLSYASVTIILYHTHFKNAIPFSKFLEIFLRFFQENREESIHNYKYDHISEIIGCFYGTNGPRRRV